MCCVRSFSTFLVPPTVLTRTISVDGSGFLLFLTLLSQLYQGFEPIDPPPYYEPEAIKFPEPLKTPSPIFDLYDPSTPPPWECPERKAMEFIAFRLTAAQLAEIHNSVAKGVEHLRISRVDTVVGLLARCLSEVEPDSRPIETVCYVINVRTFICFIFIFDRGITRHPWHSIAGWAYIRATQWPMQSFGSPWSCNSRKTLILTTVFWPMPPTYASHWGG
jgi:hypothetical protein